MLHSLHFVRMDKALKGAAGEDLEFLRTGTAQNAQKGAVGVEVLSAVCAVDQKTAGHGLDKLPEIGSLGAVRFGKEIFDQ